MGNIALGDIESLARVESAKMQHFYVGVEHLFIALTKLDGGMATSLFEQVGQSARYLRFLTRELAGRGDERRYWPGSRNSPRAAQVLERSRDLIEGGMEPAERALLLAILEEGDSIPVRALQEASVDTLSLRKIVLDWAGQAVAQAPAVTIEDGESFSKDQRLVLERMFQKYDKIKIQRVFQGGFSGSTVMLVRPLHADGRSDFPVVVKLDDRQEILREKQRYDSFVKDTLPPATARIEAEPALPDQVQLGGLKYTFVSLRGEEPPINLREYMGTHEADEISRFIREALFNTFRAAWWEQAKPYQFQVWQEYEFLLPPALIVDALPLEALKPTSRVLQPLAEWSRDGTVHPGEIVALENFTSYKAKRDKGILQLAASDGSEAVHRASRVDVHGVDFSQKMYYRGELVRRLVGRVTQNRDDLLQKQVQALEPNFNILDEYLPFSLGPMERLPNPLRRYIRLLDRRLSGMLSTIHGDMHTGNILVGPNGDAWLIDFELTRDGHMLFDWAVLETSLLIDYVTTYVGASWEDIWRAVKYLDQLNRDGKLSESDHSPLARSFRPIAEIRGIVSELLEGRGIASEYHAALAMCALRVIGWNNRPLTARRLSFLVAGLAIDAARSYDLSQLHTTGDPTEVTTDNM